jgi:hypothetical protein
MIHLFNVKRHDEDVVLAVSSYKKWRVGMLAHWPQGLRVERRPNPALDCIRALFRVKALGCAITMEPIRWMRFTLKASTLL